MTGGMVAIAPGKALTAMVVVVTEAVAVVGNFRVDHGSRSRAERMKEKVEH